MEPVFILKLSEPVKNGSEIISELKFKKMTAKEMGKLKVNPLDWEDFYPVISKLTAQPSHVIEMLDPVDIMEAIKYVGEKLAPGPVIGSKPLA